MRHIMTLLVWLGWLAGCDDGTGAAPAADALALPDAALADATPADAARPDAARPDAARPDAARPDAARATPPRATPGPWTRCPSSPTPPLLPDDADGDRVRDADDNCPAAPNPDQADLRRRRRRRRLRPQPGALQRAPGPRGASSASAAPAWRAPRT
ncbi:MAG: hypothetical protein H6706_07585 [Myxococcales bacterium]|nr:hypothetical protein [Myxococcales bacterium]